MKAGCPQAGQVRLSTRAAALIGSLARNAPGKAVALDLDALAATLGCARDSLRKITMKLRCRAWFFQGYHTLIFIRYKKHRRSKCAYPQLYAISRHAAATIGGAGTRRVKWHLRKGSAEAWIEYMAWIQNLKFAMLFKKEKPADGTYQALGPMESEKNKDRKANRPRLRVWNKLAGDVASAFSGRHRAFSINLKGWAALRLCEGHMASRISASLDHAAAVFMARSHLPCAKSASWISEVARRHLETDGLTPYNRWWWRGRLKRQLTTSSAWKVEGTGQAGLSKLTVITIRPTESPRVVIDHEGTKWQHCGGTNWKKI